MFVVQFFVFCECDVVFYVVVFVVEVQWYECVVVLFDFVDQFFDFFVVQQQFVCVYWVGFDVCGGFGQWVDMGIDQEDFGVFYYDVVFFDLVVFGVQCFDFLVFQYEFCFVVFFDVIIEVCFFVVDDVYERIGLICLKL